MHYGPEQKKIQKKQPYNYSIPQELKSEQASKVGRAEQANQRAVQANQPRNEQVAQYFRLDSCLFWTIVKWWHKKFVVGNEGLEKAQKRRVTCHVTSKRKCMFLIWDLRQAVRALFCPPRDQNKYYRIPLEPTPLKKRALSLS